MLKCLGANFASNKYSAIQMRTIISQPEKCQYSFMSSTIHFSLRTKKPQDLDRRKWSTFLEAVVVIKIDERYKSGI